MQTAEDVQDIPQQIRFPPFPKPPSGVVITPLFQFKPGGIVVDLNRVTDEPERDALGIPTVALRAKHALDTAVIGGGKKKKKKKAAPAAGEEPQRWWQIWEDEEARGKGGFVDYSGDETDLERFAHAASAFVDAHTWSKFVTITSLWDQWRVFVGLLNAHTQSKDVDGEGADLDEDDDDDEGRVDADAISSDKPPTDAPAARNNGDMPYNSDDLFVEDPVLTQRDLLLDFFVRDPAHAVKVFLSSYFRNKGLIWNPNRIHDAPKLIAFFLRFMLKTTALQNPAQIAGLKRALEVTQLAAEELPLTGAVNIVFPGTLGSVLNYHWLDLAEKEHFIWDFSQPTTHVTSDTRDNAEDEKETDMGKSQVVGGWTETQYSWPKTSDDVPSNDAWGQVPANGGGNGWFDEEPDQSSWGGKLMTIFDLLGPTAFPLTHTSGLIEASTRKIREVRMPQSPQPQQGQASRAEMVEEELLRQFASVVLVPWTWHDDGEDSDVRAPDFMHRSRGEVAMTLAEAKEKPNAFCPLKHPIVVLVPTKGIENVKVGMGVGGKFVQLVRCAKEGGDEVGEPTGYWYMHEWAHAIPSYYALKRDKTT